MYLHSTMVLFKSIDISNRDWDAEFTFHYGPIQIREGSANPYLLDEFTFHYGPIQMELKILILCLLSYLHSTMVLFKLRCDYSFNI